MKMRIARDIQKVTMLCSMSVNQVFGLYYVDSSMVTGESYRQSPTNYLVLMLPSLLPDRIFRQDDASIYDSSEVEQLLDKKNCSIFELEGEALSVDQLVTQI